MNFAKIALGLCLLFTFNTSAKSTSIKSPSFLEGQLIVRLKTSDAEVLTQVPGVKGVEVLVAPLNIYLVTLETGVMSAPRSLQNFSKMEDVMWVQLDHIVTNRSIPNDTDFSKQWAFYNPKSGADIRAYEAWEITTGGKDKKGNDLVVAVVDGWIDTNHPDLKENMWVNLQEIPNNNIDDDGNGYVDDRIGWNAETDKSEGVPDDHSTHVAGIIGAQGNNNSMVTGINWNIKIMTVDRTGATSIVVKSYGYVLANKKLWIDSKGSKGANVVSTNSSFGVDYADCKTGAYPAWNDMYNEMGKVGILSAAATANLNIDVDVKGDVPTACDSPFIVAVTNTTNDDKKNDYAAYGLQNVDLGAPGTEIWSTVAKNESMAMNTGTSMATPMVAGAIALLHSAASEDFVEFYQQAPAEAALKIKEILLKTVDKIPSLAGRTVSEGRLNVGRAAKEISGFRSNQ